ncbi:hypothetical protein M0R04_06590 [Candidatus Dojkabacteria bacterium]|jgi:hypothetical protein|nr:hypothetical protein [Candidatus Dojkabacteria bacterium]
MFKAGDRVKYKLEFKGLAPCGATEEIFTITCIHGTEIFLDRYPQGSICEIHKGGWGTHEREIQLIESTDSKGNTMSKLTAMFKVLVDKDTQILKKAGFINGDLELTPEGQSALNAVLFNANKPALVEMAKEVITEEKK